jgi:hypothetical protein
MERIPASVFGMLFLSIQTARISTGRAEGWEFAEWDETSAMRQNKAEKSLVIVGKRIIYPVWRPNEVDFVGR